MKRYLFVAALLASVYPFASANALMCTYLRSRIDVKRLAVGEGKSLVHVYTSGGAHGDVAATLGTDNVLRFTGPTAKYELGVWPDYLRGSAQSIEAGSTAGTSDGIWKCDGPTASVR